jgi:hypothetical protein
MGFDMCAKKARAIVQQFSGFGKRNTFVMVRRHTDPTACARYHAVLSMITLPPCCLPAD